ncbi:hypothetical protein I3760_02G070500 [Carya illinoinensis]|nr:hypothetical protein I3760_02G070500 [Carya illinoinensis]KAG2721192.1 hypothetical protein I3760_02G070500 [Carya illinoinensis]
MEHYWCLLRHQPKWQQRTSTMNMRRKPPMRCPTSNDSTPLANDTPDDNIEIIDERQLSKKSEKERERKRKSREGEDAEFNEVLSRMTDDRTVCMMERRKAIMKAESARMSLIALKKKMIDIKIMELDLSGIDEMHQDYFRTLRKEVYKEMKNRCRCLHPHPHVLEESNSCSFTLLFLFCCKCTVM